MALTTAAVVQAKETARRAQCSNHLRQIGFALQNYHDSHKTFPPGIVSQADGTYHAGAGAGTKPTSSTSAFALILPFMEDRVLAKSYNMNLGCATAANATAVSAVVGVFICPSNPRGRNLLTAGNGQYYAGVAGVSGAAPTDYVLSVGGHGYLMTSSPSTMGTGGKSNAPGSIPAAQRAASGAFNVNSSVAMRHFRDGVSNTFIMGEGAGGGDLFVGTPVLPKSGTDADVTGIGMQDSAVDQPWSQGYVGSNGTGGWGSVFAATAMNATYTNGALAPVNTWAPLRLNQGRMQYLRPTSYSQSYTTSAPTATSVSVSPFRSYHSGLAYFLMGDNSVRSLTDSIDSGVYVSLSSIAGRELP